ncbi:MAG: hypothetical protein ACRD0A_18260 [Acidimicrobiales bacterium]
MKKGRHRRFEEARALKQMSDNFDALFEPEDAEPCAECGAEPGASHAAWCMVEALGDDDEEAEVEAEADRN